MGFIVKKTIEINGEIYDSFYVRVENFILNKKKSELLLVIAHYDNSISASEFMSEYIEDDKHTTGHLGMNVKFVNDPLNDEGNYKNLPKDNDGDIIFPTTYTYDITTKENVEDLVTTTTYIDKEIKYIDFDDDGNEITKTKIEKTPIHNTETKIIEKTKRMISNITKSPYAYAYEKLKETYSELFGSDYIIDLI